MGHSFSKFLQLAGRGRFETRDTEWTGQTRSTLAPRNVYDSRIEAPSLIEKSVRKRVSRPDPVRAASKFVYSWSNIETFSRGEERQRVARPDVVHSFSKFLYLANRGLFGARVDTGTVDRPDPVHSSSKLNFYNSRVEVFLRNATGGGTAGPGALFLQLFLN